MRLVIGQKSFHINFKILEYIWSRISRTVMSRSCGHIILELLKSSSVIL